MNIFQVLAHEGEELVEAVKPNLEETIRTNSLKFSLLALGLLLILAVIAVFLKNANGRVKYLLFGAIALVSVLTTLYLVGSTIYLNQQSETGGPIHWHADFEIWHCGRQVNIEDPAGFSNKVGTEVVHEHNDNRMHFEGVLLALHDASIGHFFESLGGSMSSKHLTIPKDSGLTTYQDGDVCPDESAAEMQVFVYKQSLPSDDGQTKDREFSQKKLKDPQNYVISPFSQVPPGDCVILEFDKPKEKTDKLCNFYKVAKEKGELVEK